MRLTVDVSPEDFERDGLDGLGHRFDKMHEQLFTFSLDTQRELYNLRALVQGRESSATALRLPEGGGDPQSAGYAQTTVFVEGRDHGAMIYDRSKFRHGDRIEGPAIVTEMDSTTLILPNHAGEVDSVGNILINPIND